MTQGDRRQLSLRVDGLKFMAGLWKCQKSKSKCQMVDALRAVIYRLLVCQCNRRVGIVRQIAANPIVRHGADSSQPTYGLLWIYENLDIWTCARAL
jgi:hypothetical protein